MSNATQYEHGKTYEGIDDAECTWCGQDDPESYYIWRQPYDFEPGSWCCVECWEERPWK